MEENFFSVSEFSFGTVVGTVCLNLGTELRLRLPGLVNRCIFLIPKKVFIILPIETTGCFPKKGGLRILNRFDSYCLKEHLDGSKLGKNM